MVDIDKAPPHVVIVGGGFGGLYAAKALSRANVKVTLIDKRNFHLYPMPTLLPLPPIIPFARGFVQLCHLV